MPTDTTPLADPVTLITLSPDLPHGLVTAWHHALAPIASDAAHPTIALGESAVRALARILARQGDVTEALTTWTTWARSATETLQSAPDGLHLVDVHALHTDAATALLSNLGRAIPPVTTHPPDPDDALLPVAEALILADPDRAALADAIDAAFSITPDQAESTTLALTAHRHLRQSLADAQTQAAEQAIALERAMRAAIAAEQAQSQFPPGSRTGRNALANTAPPSRRFRPASPNWNRPNPPTTAAPMPPTAPPFWPASRRWNPPPPGASPAPSAASAACSAADPVPPIAR